MGIPLGLNDWAIRCNLVNVENEEMRNFTAGHITNDDGQALIASVQQALGSPTFEFHAGVSYRNILVYRAKDKAPFSTETKTQPPHDIPDKPIAGYLPTGPGSEVLRDLMQRSRDIFRDHPVNKARKAADKMPATQIWLWGQGRAPRLRPFAEVFGKRGAIISAVDLVRGVGVLLGWTRIDVPTATGYLDTDYAAKGRASVTASRITIWSAFTSKRRMKPLTKAKPTPRSRRWKRSTATSSARFSKHCRCMATGAFSSPPTTVHRCGRGLIRTERSPSRSPAAASCQRGNCPTMKP